VPIGPNANINMFFRYDLDNVQSPNGLIGFWSGFEGLNCPRHSVGNLYLYRVIDLSNAEKVISLVNSFDSALVTDSPPPLINYASVFYSMSVMSPYLFIHGGVICATGVKSNELYALSANQMWYKLIQSVERPNKPYGHDLVFNPSTSPKDGIVYTVWEGQPWSLKLFSNSDALDGTTPVTWKKILVTGEQMPITPNLPLYKTLITSQNLLVFTAIDSATRALDRKLWTFNVGTSSPNYIIYDSEAFSNFKSDFGMTTYKNFIVFVYAQDTPNDVWVVNLDQARMSQPENIGEEVDFSRRSSLDCNR